MTSFDGETHLKPIIIVIIISFSFDLVDLVPVVGEVRLEQSV